ncbi:MAG: D-aminoacylase [Kiritimatiellae bacterium]|nr:D-aminoacylase [Kiritimatiellia bacterium]
MRIADMFDWLIKDGKIIDGTGRGPVAADIGGKADRITALGGLSGRPARRTINAAGCCVCPGFIDAHSHSDAFLLVAPSAPSKIYQGVTTEIIGNCGASAAPIAGKSDLPFDWQCLSFPGQWRSMREYLGLLDQSRPAVNVVPLVGHNIIRKLVMGCEGRYATVEELGKMKRLLEESLDDGAWGLSTGLIYRPGKYAAENEVAELAAVVARRRGVYTTHIRSEKSRVLAAVAEAVGVGRKTGVKVQISHLKTAGSKNWRFIDEVISLILKAREKGVEVSADRYPYLFSCTDLDILLPDWLAANDRVSILGGLRETKTRGKVRDELAADRSASYWEGIIVATSTAAEWRGRSIQAIADKMAVEPAEAALRILEADELQTQAFYAGMNEDNMWKIFAQPFVMLGTDSSLRAPEGLFANDHPHPRAYGAFPKFLRAALDGKTVPLGEAVRKMTSLPAETFGIKGRGKLAVGNAADIVVFDPSAVKDLATCENPHQLSAGINAVLVNGELAVADGRFTGNRSGRVLKPA